MADNTDIEDRDIGIRGDVEAVQNSLRSALDDAVDYADEYLSPDRVKALEYYRGEPFGNEEEGRSQFVSRDVQDTVKALLPSMMRMFFGSQKVVEFLPEGPEDVEVAEQATDYVNWIITQDNPGFLTLHNAVKDALIQRLGVIKYWWEESEEVEEESYTGLDEMTAQMLAADDGVELIEDSMIVDQDEFGEQTMSFTIRRKTKDGRVRFAELPPEEFIIDRRARSIDTAILVGHRCEKSLSDLVAMGFDAQDIEPHLGSDELRDTEDQQVRDPQRADAMFDDGDQRFALYTEAYYRTDTDGDDIAELRKYCCIGENYEILHSEPVPEAPFADLCPDPEPHRLIGSSISDQVMDIQHVKSQTMRGMMDSLSQSIHPRTGVVEGQANMDDVLNNEVGAVIRMRREGAVQPFTTPFVGQQAFPVLEYFDTVKESRTGITDATRGLNSDAMQSSTRMAVQATVEAAQQQLELVARVFAETGLRRLYRGILGLVARNQDKPRMIRLRGEFVQMDPRSWNATMDVEVNTALGSGSDEEKLARLTSLKETQEAILQQFGPNNPLVTMGQYSHTLTKLTEIAGFRDASQFFNKLPPNWTPPPVDPEDAKTAEDRLAEAQMAEIEANVQKKAAELELEERKMRLADDRERDKQEADVLLKAADIEAKNEGVNVPVDQILALMSRNRGNVQ